MLYVTTRSNKDAFTAQKVLSQKRAADGGLFIPFREPQFTQEEMDTLREKAFSQCVADILNVLFNCRLTARDVELSAGRYPVRLKKLSQRILVGECWHNLASDFNQLVLSLEKLIRIDEKSEQECGEWIYIGVRIAVLFGIFSELNKSGIIDADSKVDISVVSGDFSTPVSLWYARKWGLPIGNIVCCCNENGNVWNFICHGQLRTDGVAKVTAIPDADIVIPESLERLIHAYGGSEEVSRYVDAVRRGGSYYVDDKILHALRRGIYVTVNSEHRILSTIPGVFTTHKYLVSPYTALAYAGLQDYRARTGENRIALILADRSPICDVSTVALSMGISVEEVMQWVDQQC